MSADADAQNEETQSAQRVPLADVSGHKLLAHCLKGELDAVKDLLSMDRSLANFGIQLSRSLVALPPFSFENN